MVVKHIFPCQENVEVCSPTDNGRYDLLPYQLSVENVKISLSKQALINSV